MIGTTTPQIARAEDGLCQEAFARWVKNSEGIYRTQEKPGSAPGEAGRESCLPDEAARKSLQRSLFSVRRRCEAPDAGSEAENTRPLIDINADVLTSAPICGQQRAAAFASPGAPAPVDPNSCLALTQRGAVYWLENTRCQGSKVIAVVEIKLASGVIKCRGHTVSAEAKLGTTRPNLNYECVENGSDCTPRSVKGIFPYCSW
ncbi:MAG: hypothetical protein EKK41_21065 [Hyphomicrobiales bacterium]|nr:MAG: hypothetical protein EKK41_21065 [Hyphomicrobiales bacterium]